MMTSGNYMRPPEEEKVYEVGDRVEVNCDHEDKCDASNVAHNIFLIFWLNHA